MSVKNYGNLPDEQLVLLAQSGDAGSADALIVRYADTARMKACKLTESVSLHDADDLTQEAMIGLLSALYSFDPDRNTSFRTYANVCMNNRLISVANSMRSKRFVPDSEILPLDELNEKADELPDPEECVIIGCTADKISRFIETGLSVFERKVLDLFLRGCKYSEIGEKLGADEKAVDNAMQRLRRKLRAELGQ